MSFNVQSIRSQFPILEQTVHGKPLVYLDNGATTQKPQMVVDAISDVYQRYNSNIHRGVHHLSNVCTDAFEAARVKVQQFINARESCEVIFTRGTTESINLLAFSFGETFLKAGDEIIISAMEHHANIVPWQMMADRKGLTLRVVPINDRGELLMDEYAKLINPRTRLVAVTHISNVMGSINPIGQIIDMAHA
ncbi:MAG: aminotransferase class V-fold PLP-dependent enzyme, partial [Breznakibacter sp.]|nr:aminotransferase class V-fold PLP-dependent enzyme [Breznakibacter sp.]